MDIGSGLIPVVAIVIVIFVGALIFEFGRRFYYWAAARLLGWSDEEKFEHETAWLDRAVARDIQLAKRDANAASNRDRRRMGVSLITLAVGVLAAAYLPWWQAILITASIYAGTTMVAGLAWKW